MDEQFDEGETNKSSRKWMESMLHFSIQIKVINLLEWNENNAPRNIKYLPQ